MKLLREDERISNKFSLSRITVLYYAIRLDSLPLEVVVADDRLPMSEDSVVLAGERTLRPPNVCHVAFDFDALVLGHVLTATPHDDLEPQVADVLDRIILFANDLSDERMRPAWENEMMFFAEERFQFVERFRDRFVVARSQLRCLDKDAVKAALCNENLFRWAFDTKLA